MCLFFQVKEKKINNIQKQYPNKHNNNTHIAMASWFSLSLPNLFDEDDEVKEEEDEDHENPSPSSPYAKSSDISAVISSQFRGVAAFLAPPPTSPDSGEISAGEFAVSQPLLGIKNDLVEIGGSFKSKLSLISSNKAVTEISRFANSLLQFGDDEDEKLVGQGVGLSEEVMSFVQDISERPQLWTDFPLSLRNGKLLLRLSCCLNMIVYV